MKILVTYYIPTGGVQTLNRQRYAALKRRGIECHHLYQWPAEGLQEDAGIMRGVDGAPLAVRVDATGGDATLMPVHVTDDDAEIKRVLDTHRFDLVIVNSNFMMLERIRRCGYGGPVIFECQGLGTIEETIGELLKALPYIHSCSNAVLYPKTEHMRRLFEALYPGIRQFSFHNGLDTDRFTYRPQSRSEPGPIVGWVGRIERNKGWRSFLRMAEAWLRRFPQLRIWMVAQAHVHEPEEYAEFERILQSFAYRERIVRHAHIPHAEMAGMYSAIGDSGGFLCSTSLNEGFGYALLEAMSCRCPVLSSDSDGPRSFILHDQTGKMYPVGQDDVGIREGIAYLTESKQREKIRLAGQRYVQEQFSLAVYADHFMAMLSELGVRR